MARRKPELTALEERLGHVFQRQELLIRALTHVSAKGGEAGRGRNYQQLEFLGDRVLGLAVADLLFAALPRASEGEMARRLSELVRRGTCAAVARAWQVGPHLKLGAGEIGGRGRDNEAILADVCEAIIGAIFVDAGYPAARALVERAFGPRLAIPEARFADPKTALQEWAQGQGRPAPVYHLLERSGPDHAPRFAVRVAVAETGEAVGIGATKRAAEKQAARALLLAERIWTEPADAAP